MSDRNPAPTIFLTAIIALVLTVLPLPIWLAIARPNFLVITVLYWSIMIPRGGGLLLGFTSGLALDVLQGRCSVSTLWRSPSPPTLPSACTC